ncbi:large ribosomal subunit protein uL30m-like [Ylistrum balloti]|uniref:large ribosomal subunit protein uL30m-like n=1 Tax=Ylistrum balloti TaxID=509963 RepID=UPI002905B042|nr:large ribosomal subunit protein uL30m-like [Ylistrum balloti]
MAAVSFQGQTWSLLRKITQTSVVSVRCKSSISKKYWKERERDTTWAQPLLDWQEEKQKIQNQEISPLHMVVRIHNLKGIPKKEKEIAKILGFGEGTKKQQKVLLKNIPTINEQLKFVQHLVKIVPVTFPYGLPESEEDYEHCYLRDNGEFVVRRKIPSAEEGLPENVGTTVDWEPSVWEMDRETVQKQNRKKLVEYDINSEFFKPQYVYKNNKDGKEHTYFGDKRFNDRGRTWY